MEKRHFGYYFPPLLLPWLSYIFALVPGNIIILEFGYNQLDLFSSPFAEPGPLLRHLNRAVMT